MSKPDCTNRCQSTQHGAALTAAITKRCVNDSDLCAYFTHTCCSCESVWDSNGRAPLHVAASCGRTDLVRWLVENRHANVNVRDKESGYTALHRSIFYGKIDTTVELIKLGSNVALQDCNGLTFLEHAMLDRFRPSRTPLAGGELFAWGPNSNNSLGSQHPRSVPETMDIFHKEYPNENVQEILINQFHSVILMESGTVYSCGHGQGGRLGLGSQKTEVIPKLIKFPPNAPRSDERVQITSCSIARDHSLFLASGGELYSCGLNKHRVLGIVPPPAELLAPRILKQLPDASFVATGNYHSVFWNKSGVYTWGLNAGQLGHQLISAADDAYILTPKRVTCISSKENTLKLVCASTGATVAYTEKGDVYVLHEYQCRKIASRQLNLVQISVIGGKLTNVDCPDKNRELKVAALTNNGNLLLWQETDPVLRRCTFSLNRALNLKQLSLNVNQVLFVTSDGEAFKGEIKLRKKKQQPVTVEKAKNIAKSEFHKFLEKDECVSVKLERIPRIHRAVCIESDPMGQNFGIVQERPYKFFNHYNISESTMLDNMHELLSTADNIADIQFNVGGKLFPCHKYILASRSPYFANLFAKNQDPIIPLKGFNPNVFEELLRYIYTGTTELIQIGELKNPSLVQLCLKPLREEGKENVIVDENQSAFQHYSNNKKTSESERKPTLNNPVRMLHEMAKRFEVVDLQKTLTNLDMVKQTVRIKKDGREMTKSTNPIFNKNICPELYDVEILCRDDRVLRAHKCILVARLDYFGSMFSSRWRGGETSKITMPYAKGVVEALLEFLYTDSLDRLEDRDVDQLFKIIILADQFFVTRLKDQCENILSELLTVKNATQLLTFADTYNADRLKENCFEFIQQNMTSFLEMRLLDDVEPDVLKELSEFYQIKRGLDCRVITPYSTAVSDEDIARISAAYPVDITEKKEKQKIAAPKKRVRTHKSSEKALSNDSSLLSVSFSSDTQEADISLDNSPMAARVGAIMLAKETLINNAMEIEEDFTPLKNRFDFPALCSPPKPSGCYNRAPHRTKAKTKFSKVALDGASSPPTKLAESPKNPWKINLDLVSPINSPPNEDISTIIWSEKRLKENLVKITNKQLAFTQLEDRAMDELRKFYSVDQMEEEVIVIERVSVGAVALPTWVPK